MSITDKLSKERVRKISMVCLKKVKKNFSKTDPLMVNIGDSCEIRSGFPLNCSARSDYTCHAP